MRAITPEADFRATAISGTHTVLIALNCAPQRCAGLMGFAFKREVCDGADTGPKWLRSLKVFRSIVPDPKKERNPNDPNKPQRFSTRDHPIQSFLWGDYSAQPDTLYRFTIVPMYGRPGALEPRSELTLEIRTEKPLDEGHGVWFNRGAIASQAFARKFENKAPSNPDDPNNPETAWLSRGLLEACLAFINDTPRGDGLRVAAYEFTYKPILDALKTALNRGVDVRIVYHNTAGETGEKKAENENAIAAAGLPKKVGPTKILFPRTKTKIPHNKFIVRLQGGSQPTQVWTGSTNFTASGFLGQTNVGHLVDDSTTARQFLSYWELLKKDPGRDAARAGATKLTPNPPALIPAKSIAQVFSPRPKSEMLKWYGDRIEDATASVMFTAAFGVTKALVGPLTKERDFLRFVLMEKPPTKSVGAALKKDHDLIIAYGASLGEMYVFKDGKPVKRKKIQEFELDKWLLEEDHYRHEGFVFFVHTKFLLIDPLSDDPLVCSGSANFSPNSLLANDENMLLIRGDTRVADIYLTEFDRIFRHFYFRDVANEIEAKGRQAEGVFLDETSGWTDSYFRSGTFKTARREMFFADPAQTWVANATMHEAQPGKKSSSKAKGVASNAKPKGLKTTKTKGNSTKKKGPARRRVGKTDTRKTRKPTKRAARKTQR